MSRLKEKYQNEVVPALIKRFGYRNIHQVPRLEKIVVNMGVGDATQDSKALRLPRDLRCARVIQAWPEFQ